MQEETDEVTRVSTDNDLIDGDVVSGADEVPEGSPRAELIEIFEERASFYRLLSSLYFKEVSAVFIKELAQMDLPIEDDGSLLGEGYHRLRRYLVKRGPDPRTDLAVDYARVFLAAGTYEGESAVPYESIYTSKEGLIMQEARDEVRKIYIQNSVNVSASLNMPEDHLSFELEFLAIMSDRAIEAVRVNDRDLFTENIAIQRDFIVQHPLAWIEALREKVEACSKRAFYPAIAMITEGYLEKDCELLDEILEKFS